MSQLDPEAQKYTTTFCKVLISENKQLTETLLNMINLVKATRNTQREYFATRSKASLIKSKELEIKLDKLAEDLLTQITQQNAPDQSPRN